jgi:hypothetical protein
MNEIGIRQNSDSALRLLAAQQALYSSAKQWQGWQFFLLVPVTIGLSLGALWHPGWKSYAALYGISMMLLDSVVVRPRIGSLRKEAARVQELFDCDVLEITWNKFRIGRRPETEIVEENYAKFLSRGGAETWLKDWYPPSVANIPVNFARIICQRQNCWWDSKLRRRYAGVIVATTALSTFIAVIASLVGGLTLEKFILVVLAPLLPIWSVGLRQYSEHKESADSEFRIKELAEALWETAVATNNGPSAQESRALQDSILDHRMRSPLIFNWFYFKHKKQFEAQARKSADEASRAIAGKCRE